MNRVIRPARIILFFAVMAAAVSIYTAALYKLQIYDPAPERDELLPIETTPRRVTLAANRGDVLDRNGVLLVSSRPSYNITLTYETFRAAPNTNEALLALVHAAARQGIVYTDTFPVTIGAPFTYRYDATDAQRNRLSKYLKEFRLPEDISASDLMVWMKTHYGIDYMTGISDARLIIGVRYEMETRAFQGMTTTPYIFAEDVGIEFVSLIREGALPGVNIETASVREYHTEHAAHLLGYIGLMTAAEYEKYKELGYPMDASVGKYGAEAAFERYLHGTDGAQTLKLSENGSVVSVETTREPVPGGNVYLSIDIGLQAAAEKALADKINAINAERDLEAAEAGGEDVVTKAVGGAVVVTGVNTGETLAAATYPTFAPAEYKTNYAALAADTSSPLLNRAMQGTYNPGSTFKMATALTGLRAGVITRWTEINDTGIYDKYETFKPRCWLYQVSGVGHGELNLLGALENSCNYYFYQVGDNSDPEADGHALAAVASEFGLGVKTGLEIFEEVGTLATKEYKIEKLGESWWRADTLLAAIGQGHNKFTPAQIANYTATIANGGTRYDLTLLHNVRSADFSAVVYSGAPVAANVIPETEFISYLQEGMRAAAYSGTANAVFRDYPVRVAAKTGTVQSDTSAINNGVFVCYAPADNPEIAISVVVENGGSGAAIMEIAKVVLDYYFADEGARAAVPEGELMP